MEDCNPVVTPMELGTKLSKFEGGEPVDADKYQSLVGSLRYLTSTRPDLSYSVGVISRFMENPKYAHWKALKRILRYVKGTKSFGLFYSSFKENTLTGYFDSDWHGDVDDRKSTSGYVFFMGKAAFTWASKKQQIVALSTCEAEYVAASWTVCHAIWLRNLLRELKDQQEGPTEIKVDNKSAIELARNPVHHERSKHIDNYLTFAKDGNEGCKRCRLFSCGSMCDYFSDKGIYVKGSPIEVVKISDVVITMFLSSRHVLDVYTGAQCLLNGGNPMRAWLYIDSSTIDPQTTRKLASANCNQFAIAYDITCKSLAYLELRGPLPLEDEQVRLMHENLRGKGIKYCGKSATKLVSTIARHFPGFRDHTVYKGHRVFLYKRDQIFAANVWGAFKGKGFGEFSDVGSIAIFADYIVPAVLQRLGVLRYTSTLANGIQSNKEIGSGIEKEVELRACSISAVEQMRDLIQKRTGKQVLSLELDLWLWAYDISNPSLQHHLHGEISSLVIGMRKATLRVLDSINDIRWFIIILIERLPQDLAFERVQSIVVFCYT
uniref:Retrovirus-related Pol polyprotein from transposon TNT 1-94 n=1 Tax=Tanacetum cinerariifolium TaxID=118510 RepID=A0A6L2JMP5_TANCI|nr:retrovirus-related Pol polyprotein from transposon TNT 1-94 [Tanacetum cinerariifolium]